MCVLRNIAARSMSPKRNCALSPVPWSSPKLSKASGAKSSRSIRCSAQSA